MSKSRRRHCKSLAPIRERRESVLAHATSSGGQRYLSVDAETERQWLTGCRGKRIFDSERVAINEARVMEVVHHTPMKVYACHFCGRWHLTTDHERTRYAQDELGMMIWRLERHLRERGMIP